MNKTNFIIYMLDEDGKQWYYTGKRFSEIYEEAMVYSTNKTKDFTKEHYLEVLKGYMKKVNCRPEDFLIEFC